MPFGCSAGDFFIATSLIVQAGLALREAGGSAQEYRQLYLYLSTLQRVLGEVDKLEPVNGLAVTVNAIKATGACLRTVTSDREKCHGPEQSSAITTVAGVCRTPLPHI
jgi:hypothetical protein